MSEPNFILAVFKLVIERKRVVIIHTFTVAVVILQKFVIVQVHCELSVAADTWDLVLHVFYVVAGSLPPFAVLLGVRSSSLTWVLLSELF